MKRSPIKRTSATKRRTTSPRCSVARCTKRAEIRGWCISHAEQRADRLFSKWVRERDGVCTAMGILEGDCKGNLQAAHIVGRRRTAVRFDPDNVHALCMGHHMTVDQHGQEHAKYIWAEVLLGYRFDALLISAQQPTKRRESIETALGWLADRGQA